MDIGEHHPHALVYPLTAALKSSSMACSNSAAKILSAIGKFYPDLVQQTAMVCEELVRVSVNWEELWCKSIDAALIKREKINELLDIIEPLIAMLHKAKTPNEKMFFEVCE